MSPLLFHIQCALVILLYDLNGYYIHRLFHAVPYLYRTIHRKHHEHTVSHAWTAFHGSFVDNTLMSLGGLYAYLLFYPHISIAALITGCTFTTLQAIITHEPILCMGMFHRVYGDHHLIHHRRPNVNFGTWHLDFVHGTLH